MSGTGGFYQSVVGESFYQEELKTLAAQHSAPGVDDICTVILRAETDNPHDATTVAVLTRAGKRVGHVPRERGAKYWTFLRALETTHARVAECQAHLTGDTPDRPHHGITLDLVSPAECEARLTEALGGVRPTAAAMPTPLRGRLAAQETTAPTHSAVPGSDVGGGSYGRLCMSVGSFGTDNAT